MSNHHNFIPYKQVTFEPEEMIERSHDYHELMDKRRSLRMFSDRPVSQKVIENIVRTASTAPSGAHKQPWTFCVIGNNPELRKKIREAAEKEEHESYTNRMPDTWLKDLEPFGTDWNKPFLETAPWLVIVFKKAYDLEDGDKKTNYYVNESVGIACGFLLTAIHYAGLVA
ncbi:MAG: nitroreductase family protein, partial [Bacteroidetes bacterium]|nr:nitroreductase family protein [Bacteroidota bacterium]